MKSKAKRPTVAEAARMARLKEMPCVACEQEKFICRITNMIEVHHLLSGNKRRGHLFTIPLCLWHHRGESLDLPWTASKMRESFGPSLARASKQFHATFGTDDELLERTNKLLERTSCSH